jgi:Lrp/AsnC family leucine-responsive transcriptional regulator
MDHIDTKILHCLTEDARMNASQISQKVNLSVSAVIERMKKMEASGLIRGYTAVIDEEKAGLGVQALLSIRLEHPKYNEEFNRQMCNHAHVIECFYITGDFDYIARIGVASSQELTRVLNDIKQIPGVSLTRTYVVLDNVKVNPALAPHKDAVQLLSQTL